MKHPNQTNSRKACTNVTVVMTELQKRDVFPPLMSTNDFGRKYNAYPPLSPRAWLKKHYQQLIAKIDIRQ